jgi:hypothetical protein
MHGGIDSIISNKMAATCRKYGPCTFITANYFLKSYRKITNMWSVQKVSELFFYNFFRHACN